jgi:hypothetical protein
MTARRCSEPALWTETDTWAEVAWLAAARGLRLDITHDLNHPLNPWVRLIGPPLSLPV